ncbi:MAG TPA: ATP-binding protein, partial [bacterium]|nr:ATP-binding protein [bacterium]
MMDVNCILEQIPTGVLVCSRLGAIEYANQSLERLIGFPKKDLQRMSLSDLFLHQDILTRCNNISRESRPEPVRVETEMRRADNTTIAVELCASCRSDKPDDDGTLLLFVNDLSRLKELQGDLRHSQSMEALGILAGGIAHDFNNILAAVLGYSELCEASIDENHEAQSYVSQIRQAAGRAKELVGQMLLMSRRTERGCQPVIVSAVVKEVIKLLRSSIASSASLVSSIDKSEDKVLAEPVQIHQLTMNLFMNAYQALNGANGTIEVELTHVDILPNQVTKHFMKRPGSYVCLRVKDNGSGMDEQTLGNIFKPYFTTKREGTGIGLSNVKGIVRMVNGEIFVQSTLGEGTTFWVYLPVHRESVDQSTPLVESESAGEGEYKEHILFLDDEEPITNVMRMGLARLGYDVTAFTSSEDALQAFLSSPKRFDVIVSDYQMPSLSGSEVVNRVLQERPDIPVVICSGSVEHEQDVLQLKSNCVQFVKKPIEAVELDRVIRKVVLRCRTLAES